MTSDERPSITDGPRIAIIGSGFGGLAMGHALRRAGIDSFTIYEKGADVGGVWRENTYPGAACDVISHLYSFSFERHYSWSSRYGRQAEILDYLRHVARQHDLLRHIRFGRELAAATFDEARGRWALRFTDGQRDEADVLVTAVGQLHRPQYPAIHGRDSFAGVAFHSARWNHDYPLDGKRVGVIGTGASAVQFVPAIAPRVRQLAVFQRSASYVLPKPDWTLSRFTRRLLAALPFLQDLDRFRAFWTFEFLSTGLQPGRPFAGPIRRLVELTARLFLRAQVPSAAMRAKLRPDGPGGCKRALFSNDWLPALCRPNVELVTDQIEEIVPSGVRTRDGALRELDALIYGTGFTATDFLAPIDVRGRDGQSLRERWKDGPAAYLGITTAGFPNLFMLYGPNTNLGAGSIIFMLECQSRYVAQCIEELRRRPRGFMDVRPAVQAACNEMLGARSRSSPYEAGCHSWYIGPDGRNVTNWPGYMTEYKRLVAKPDWAAFEFVPAAGAPA